VLQHASWDEIVTKFRNVFGTLFPEECVYLTTMENCVVYINKFAPLAE
jgi:hypothetical protein